MKTRLLLIFTFFLTLISNAQNAKQDADSLFQVWENKQTDYKIRIKALHAFIKQEVKTNYPDSAIHLYDQAMVIAKSQNDQKYISRILLNQSLIFENNFQYEKALEYGLKSVEIHQALKDTIYVEKSKGVLGNAYYRLGEFEKAKELYMEWYQFLKVHDPTKTKPALFRISQAMIAMGSFAETTHFIEKELNDTSNRLSIADIISLREWLTETYFRQGLYQQAIDILNEIADFHLKNGDSIKFSSTLNKIGANYQKSGDDDKALEAYQQCYEIQVEKNLRHSDIVYPLHNLASVYSTKGKYDTAIVYFQKCLELDFSNSREHKHITSKIYQNMGSTYLKMGEYNRGIYYLNKSMDLAQENHKMEDILENYFNLNRAYYLAENMDSSFINSSLLVEKRKRDISANFPLLSELEKQQFLTKMKHEFQSIFVMASTDFKNNPLACQKAYDISLLIKGILLKSSRLMRMSIMESGDTLLQTEFQNWMTLKRNIAQKYAQGIDCHELEEQALALEKKLSTSSKLFANFNEVTNQSWQDIRNALEEGEVAIEIMDFSPIQRYNLDADSVIYGALILKKDWESPKYVHLFSESDLIEIIGKRPQTGFEFINKIYGTKKNENHQLYDLIWKPLEEHLNESDKIFLSPSGLLHKIALPAISKEKNVYLCDLHEINFMNSTSQIKSKKLSQFDTNKSIALFGGIDFSGKNAEFKIWEYLEGTKSEILEINKLLENKSIHPSVFLSQNATEKAFKDTVQNMDIIHVATHGFFFQDPKKIHDQLDIEFENDLVFRGKTDNKFVRNFVNSSNPLMRSGIVFAGANDYLDSQSKGSEDGVLTAEEVATMNLNNTKLVVLSACETGLGEIQESEGVYGLQRAFKIAGVEYLIMSLWQVPDKETSEFMARYYANLISMKDYKQAFYQTQLEMRKKYDPYFWAAFVLVD
ncbi:MAG: CHAT domain-containing tetratricopeptide repeat protein [Crocinitomicaceae bacterium]